MSISIEYVLIGKTSSIKIDPIKKKLKDFKEAIIEANPKLKLKLNNVSISYKDKLCDNNDVVLNKIIDSFDKHPKFEVKTTEEDKKSINETANKTGGSKKSEISANANSKKSDGTSVGKATGGGAAVGAGGGGANTTRETSAKKMNLNKTEDLGEPKMLTHILVENFPSRVELFTVVDKYLESIEKPKNYKSFNKGASVELHFSDSDISFEFLKYFNTLKMKNNLYSRCKINLIMETAKPVRKFKPKDLYHYDYNKIASAKRSFEELTLQKSLGDLKEPGPESSRIEQLGFRAKKKKIKVIKDYLLKDHFFINNAVPYIDEAKEKIEKAKDKSLIVSKKEYKPCAIGFNALERNKMPHITWDDKYLDKKLNLFRNEDKHKWVGQSFFNNRAQPHRNLYKLEI